MLFRRSSSEYIIEFDVFFPGMMMLCYVRPDNIIVDVSCGDDVVSQNSYEVPSGLGRRTSYSISLPEM
eukprot:12881246-Prorocentrum_lima.AAC.1